MYRFESLANGAHRETDLWLEFSVYCDALYDGYEVGETTAVELWDVWRELHPRDEQAEVTFGVGALRVSWFVRGRGVQEVAPFQDDRIVDADQTFLTHYSWPVDAATGERVRWAALPVRRKQWSMEKRHKGGFITEATGWTPSPFQPYVNVRLLALASGLA